MPLHDNDIANHSVGKKNSKMDHHEEKPSREVARVLLLFFGLKLRHIANMDDYRYSQFVFYNVLFDKQL